MPKYSANLTFLYQEHSFFERFAAAARDGFKAVEYLGPYAETKEAVIEALAANDLQQVLFNVPSGDWAGGERGIACLPGRSAEFRSGIATALDYATALKCPQVNVIAGIIPAGADLGELENVFVDNLKFAARAAADAGVRMLIEPINDIRDIPGFFLTTTNQAERILERVGSDNLYIQYDIYHIQVMQGDLIPTFQRLEDRIAHIQIADTPGRNEPGTGEINYRFVLSELDRLGYEGWVGCEYRPKGGTSEGLGWMLRVAD